MNDYFYSLTFSAWPALRTSNAPPWFPENDMIGRIENEENQ